MLNNLDTAEWRGVDLSIDNKVHSNVKACFLSYYCLIALTTIKRLRDKKFLGAEQTVKKVQGVVTAQNVLHKEDLIGLYGCNNDLKKFLKEQGQSLWRSGGLLPAYRVSAKTTMEMAEEKNNLIFSCRRRAQPRYGPEILLRVVSRL